jgi:hypothetical protein
MKVHYYFASGIVECINQCEHSIKVDISGSVELIQKEAESDNIFFFTVGPKLEASLREKFLHTPNGGLRIISFQFICIARLN